MRKGCAEMNECVLKAEKMNEKMSLVFKWRLLIKGSA
jgi:hypothetical protein